MPLDIRLGRLPKRQPLAILSALLLSAACSRPPATEAAAPGAAATGATPPGADAPDGVPAPAGALPGSPPAAPDATASTPARPTEAALRGHIASIQGGTPDDERLTPELAGAVRAPRFMADVKRLGAVESVVFRGVAPNGLDRYEVSSKEGFSEWLIGLAPDGKTTGLFLRVLEKPPSAPLSQAQLIAELEARVASATAAGEFAGAVLVARGGKPIYQAAAGFADRERLLPNTLETRFRIGSMNKMFTAVAILQLVQAGKLSLSDPLGKHLKNYPNVELARDVTIEHLLTHTGGTGDIFGPEFAQHRRDLRQLRDYVRLFGARGTAFPPGSRWEYSNYGFVLLGVVIEQVSGQSYYDYVARHVYGPAKMSATASLSEDQAVPGRAIGYMRYRPEGTPAPAPGVTLFPNTSTLPYRGSSAGGGYSTVADLLAFARALESHVLLDAEHTAALTTVKPGLAAGANYAYGFADMTRRGVRCFGHNGGAPGMSGVLLVCKPAGEAESIVIAVLSNLDPPSAVELGEFIRARLPLAPAAEVTARADCADATLDDLEDGDERVPSLGDRAAQWRSFHDPRGTTLEPAGPFKPTAAGARGSRHAAHVSGRTGPAFPVWAGINVAPDGQGVSADLSRWSRICFQAKGSGSARFAIADVNTDPAGGVCRQCYNNFGKNLELQPDWREFCYDLDELTQLPGWGDPHPLLTASKAFSIAWSVHSPDSAYDLWVDDVRLVCR